MICQQRRSVLFLVLTFGATTDLCSLHAFAPPATNYIGKASFGLTLQSSICDGNRVKRVLNAIEGGDEQEPTTRRRLEDRNVPESHRGLHDELYGDGDDHGATSVDDSTSAVSATVERVGRVPTLNGKMVLPVKVLKAGLDGHKIAAVYAVINYNYRKGTGDGWEHCEYVGITRNLEVSLMSHVSDHGNRVVSHVRVLSFAYPQRSAMEEVASQWRDMAREAGGKGGESSDRWASSMRQAVQSSSEVNAEHKREHEKKKQKLQKAMAHPVRAEERNKQFSQVSDAADFADRRAIMKKAMEATSSDLFIYEDDEDDEDEDYDDWSMEVASQSLESMRVSDTAIKDTVISPFTSLSNIEGAGAESLPFSKENVDKILDEVRPYLIADGGNVSVQRVDEETRNVYLVLEGACGSCASSTVTMRMGIERVLKENFVDIGEVMQVEEPGLDSTRPTELTWKTVEDEVNRIKPAIVAMGGVVDIVGVDPIGVVELRFRGSNKVQHGLELAIRDVPFVKHVKFVI